MPGVFDPKRSVPLFDLETVLNTLTYIRDDMQRVPALQPAAELIAATLAELRAVERRLPHCILKINSPLRRKH